MQDFRASRIGDRLKKADIAAYLELFKETPLNRRLILGSCWPMEMEIFSHPSLQKDILEKNIQVAIAPHSLKDESIKEIVQAFNRNTSNKIPLYELNENVDASALKDNPGVIMITSKGILCELYSIFGQSYVGGGFGRSIHSVLEPYLAGSRVYCGPKTYRSTEYDFVRSHSPDYIHVVRKLGEFYDSYVDEPINSDEISLREEILLESNKDFKRIISLLAGKMNE